MRKYEKYERVAALTLPIKTEKDADHYFIYYLIKVSSL